MKTKFEITTKNNDGKLVSEISLGFDNEKESLADDLTSLCKDIKKLYPNPNHTSKVVGFKYNEKNSTWENVLNEKI